MGLRRDEPPGLIEVASSLRTVVWATSTSLRSATAVRYATSTLVRMSSVVVPSVAAVASALRSAARMFAEVWPKS